MVSYIGNGPYCYANATAMLLSAVGENISPSKIEVLTGVGLGAFWVNEGKFTVFSSIANAPDDGVGKAMDILGFDYKHGLSGNPANPPFDELRASLQKTPAVLGPLDMGYLNYNPNHRFLGGTDHFVLAYGMNDSELLLHDPEGFPHVSLPFHQMELAWRAEQIPYRHGHYRYWTEPKQVRKPTTAEIYADALKFFRETYTKSDELAKREKWIINREAVQAFADSVREGRVSARENGFMVHFAFKLGARRALDFAAFFDQEDRILASLKRRQAELFGRSHVLATRGDWSNLGNALSDLADVEEEFRRTLIER